MNGAVGEGERFFWGQQVVSLEQFAKVCGTASMVTRWREAHPELVGTDEDVLNVTVRELREALGGREWLERGGMRWSCCCLSGGKGSGYDRQAETKTCPHTE